MRPLTFVGRPSSRPCRWPSARWPPAATVEPRRRRRPAGRAAAAAPSATRPRRRIGQGRRQRALRGDGEGREPQDHHGPLLDEDGRVRPERAGQGRHRPDRRHPGDADVDGRDRRWAPRPSCAWSTGRCTSGCPGDDRQVRQARPRRPRQPAGRARRRRVRQPRPRLDDEPDVARRLQEGRGPSARPPSAASSSDHYSVLMDLSKAPRLKGLPAGTPTPKAAAYDVWLDSEGRLATLRAAGQELDAADRVLLRLRLRAARSSAPPADQVMALAAAPAADID